MEDIFSDEDYQIWSLLTQARNAIAKVRQRELMAYDLTRRQAAILQISKATEGDVTPFKIAKWAILEPHAILAALKTMERKELIRRVNKEGRRKATGVVLTDKGNVAYKDAIKLVSIHKVMDSLSKEERSQLKHILKKLRDEALKQIGMSQKRPFPPL